MRHISNKGPHKYAPERGLVPEEIQGEPAAIDDENRRFVHSRQTEPRATEPSPAPSQSDSAGTTGLEAIPKNTATGSSTPSKGGARTRRLERTNEKYWLTESGSCAVALGALAALVGILVQHDGQPLPDWKYGITLNALVSVLSSVLKAAAVLPLAGGISQAKWLWYKEPRPLKDMETFDDASRGPWGSFLLMLDFRSHYVASFGAFLTVVAMAVDPFTQQVVQTQPCLREDTSAVALIPRANIYNVTTSVMPNWDSGRQNIYPALAVSIYRGLITPPENASSVITPICPSGNCTFPDHDGAAYQTIAMCHKCDNITDLVEITHSPRNGEKYYTLPSGINVTYDHPLSTTSSNSTPMTGDSEVFYVEMAMYTNNSDLPWDVSNDPMGGIHVFGARCRLFPCVKTYGAQISRNTLEEREMASEDIKVRPDSLSILVTEQTIRNGVLRNCSTTPNRTAENVIPVIFKEDQVNTTWASEDCYWEFSRTLLYQADGLLKELFDGNSLSSVRKNPTPVGDIWLVNLYNAGTANMASVNRYMGALAASLTQQMRTEGFRGSAAWAEGVVMLERTCVQVNWPWLALPASLLLLVPLFIGLTVAATRRTRWREEHGLGDGAATAAGGVGFLKASPLALLFFGLHRDVVDERDRPGDAVAMREAAQNVEVSLKWCWIDGQWQFVKSEKTGR
ncbi:hypothetical protein PG985_010272 [Apiospora marii]|uniref:uncharacterized protein n=1 Tax=Apiospora marii TaxID=335849 RepID=UPI00312ED811